MPAYGYVDYIMENIELLGNAHGRKQHTNDDHTHNRHPHPYNQPHPNQRLSPSPE